MEDKDFVEILTGSEGILNESRRVAKVIQDFKISSEEAQSKGILARGSKLKGITKSSLKGQKPDKWDKKNIESLIETYNIAFPYPHEQSLQTVIEENKKIVRKKNKKGTIILSRRLPVPFVKALKVAYPLIFSDKIQSAWFDKNFPQFSLKKGE